MPEQELPGPEPSSPSPELSPSEATARPGPRPAAGYGPPRRVGFGEALSRGFRGSFSTSGRATRSEYWWFQLLFTVVYVAAAAVDAAVGAHYWILAFTVIAFFAPVTSVGIRRLHDQSKSGWAYLLVLVPFVGPFIVLGILCVASTPRPNHWGPALTA